MNKEEATDMFVGMRAVVNQVKNNDNKIINLFLLVFVLGVIVVCLVIYIFNYCRTA